MGAEYESAPYFHFPYDYCTRLARFLFKTKSLITCSILVNVLRKSSGDGNAGVRVGIEYHKNVLSTMQAMT